MSHKVHRPVYLVFIALLLGVLLFEACAPAAAPAASPTAAPKASAQPATTATSAAPAATPAQTAGAQQQSNQTPIKIGLVESLTGTLAQSGKDNLDGFNLYMDKIGSTVAGRKIQLIVEDDQTQPDVALTKTRKLVENDKVDLVAGFHFTAVCYAVAPYLKQQQALTMVTGNCAAQGLTLDPALRSPYIWRTTQSNSMLGYTLGEWLVQNGYKKVVFIGADAAPGWEAEDGLAMSFIGAGGTIIQELYPAMGTPDFAPIVAQINPDANAVIAFATGADAVRLTQQYEQYGLKAKIPLFDFSGQILANLSTLKDTEVGLIAPWHYVTDLDNAENKAFLTAFKAKYPGVLVGADYANGYLGGQVIEAAIKATNGDMSKDKFVAALKTLQVNTIQGPFKFDAYQNVAGNWYVKRLDKSGNDFVEKTLATVPNVTQFGKWPPEQMASFPWGKNKGKYGNITKDQLVQMFPFLK